MSGTSNETARKLLETVSFELDTDLRLHPSRLELGKAELLTDALTLPLKDIEKRLAQYVAGTSKADGEMLRRSMKNYLARLNANPLIPLNFRLKVLARFEQELELFDGEMTAAVLNAHKIGIEMVQKEARANPALLPVLAGMVANAIELAVRLLRISLEEYRAPAVIATRQVFDLARLGLSVVPVLDEKSLSQRERVQKAIASHEFLRMMDLFGKSREEQRMCWEELQHHVGVLHPVFVRKGGPKPEFTDSALLVTNTVRPNDPPKVLEHLPDALIADVIAIPLDAFIERLVTAVNRVESVLQSQELQKMDLHTEQSLHTTITGGNALLEALRERQREAKREEVTGTRVVIEPDASKALLDSHAALVMSDYEYAPSRARDEQAWSVVNISEQGAGLERVCDAPLAFEVGSLIGISWIPHQGEPMLGVVRWIKEPKPGEQRMGVKFLRGRMKLFKAGFIGGGDELTERRTWPVLVGAGNKGTHLAVFPDARIVNRMAFVILHDGERLHYKVRRVRRKGPNYTICEIARAEEVRGGKGLGVSV